MKRSMKRLCMAVYLFVPLVLMIWMSAAVSAEEAVETIDAVLVEQGGEVTVASQHAGAEGVSSLQLQLAVKPEKACNVEFAFNDTKAKVAEYRYDKDGGYLFLYLAGTDPLFGGGDRLVLGKITVRDEYGNDVAASVWVEDFGYVYGSKVESIDREFLDVPSEENPAKVNREEEETPEPPATPDPPEPGEVPAPGDGETSTPGDGETGETPAPGNGGMGDDGSRPEQTPPPDVTELGNPVAMPESTPAPTPEPGQGGSSASVSRPSQAGKPSSTPGASSAPEPEEENPSGQDVTDADGSDADDSAVDAPDEGDDAGGSDEAGSRDEEEAEEVIARVEDEDSSKDVLSGWNILWVFLAVSVVLAAVAAGAIVFFRKKAGREGGQ